MVAAYETLRGDGRLPATFEVVYGQAWSPTGDPAYVAKGGEVAVPFSRIGRRSPST